MPLDRPTRAELIELARSEIEARIPGADARLPRSFLDVLARIVGAQVHGVFGHLAYHVNQPFPQLAASEWLRRSAELYGVGEVPPEYARGNVTLTGTNGIVVPQDTSLRRVDGREYLTTAQVVITAGEALTPVIAVEAGSEGNAAAGVVLKLTSSQAGVNSEAEVDDDGLTGGSDVETDDALRVRVLARIQKPPAGGTVYDYERQARLYPGVTDVFVHALQFGAGTVGVAPMFYDRDDPIPLLADVQAVQALVTAAGFRPVCATVTTYALEAEEQDFTIELDPDEATVKGAVESELRDLFRREARPGGVLRISHIREAISRAAGEIDHVLTEPIADIDLADDLEKISVVGTITWEP